MISILWRWMGYHSTNISLTSYPPPRPQSHIHLHGHLVVGARGDVSTLQCPAVRQCTSLYVSADKVTRKTPLSGRGGGVAGCANNSAHTPHSLWVYHLKAIFL